jgi:hypothetical protein
MNNRFKTSYSRGFDFGESWIDNNLHRHIFAWCDQHGTREALDEIRAGS